MKSTNPAQSRDLPLSVENTAFLLERLGKDCHPLQFLRELTQNAIEAIQTTGAAGEILWDVDWLTFDLADEPVYKLCIVDTGVGMTGDEQIQYINKLSSSIHTQSMGGNYGVGAKIAALPRNPEGLMYLSWKNDQGTMIHLRKNRETGQYGLELFQRNDGSFGHYLPLEEDVEPELIEKHGTKVILLGRSDDDNTMEPPEGVPSPSRWIAKYLNTRYFCFPDSLNIRAREGWQYPRDDSTRNKLRTITGQKKYLEDHKVASGYIKLTDATANWWILKETDALSHDSNYYASTGHVAALYRDEIYELSSGRTSAARLQQFGVIFGHRLVVIYIEPVPQDEAAITTNTARTQLLLNSEPLPWDDWASEFREKMPTEIVELIESKAAKSSGDHRDSIRDRLKPLLNLFTLSRYRPAPRGELELEDDRTPGGKPAKRPITRRSVGARSGGKGGSVGNVYAAFQKTGGETGEAVDTDPFPEVLWLSVIDGTREAGDLEDRAARYLKDQNRLLINADFRLIDDTIAYWTDAYGEPARGMVTDVVREWIEQALVEAVLGVRSFEGTSREWTTDDIQRALSEEALTTAIQQRYHIHTQIKRSLGTKLGSLKAS